MSEAQAFKRRFLNNPTLTPEHNLQRQMISNTTTEGKKKVKTKTPKRFKQYKKDPLTFACCLYFQ